MEGDCGLWLGAVELFLGRVLPLRPRVRGWYWGMGCVVSMATLRRGDGAVCMNLLSALAIFLLVSCVPMLTSFSR